MAKRPTNQTTEPDATEPESPVEGDAVAEAHARAEEAEAKAAAAAAELEVAQKEISRLEASVLNQAEKHTREELKKILTESHPLTEVQFLERYAWAGVPSANRRVMRHAGFSVTAGEIVKISDRALEMISEDHPDLVETDPNKFKDMTKWTRVLNRETGRHEIMEEPVPVATLRERARVVGVSRVR